MTCADVGEWPPAGHRPVSIRPCRCTTLVVGSSRGVILRTPPGPKGSKGKEALSGARRASTMRGQPLTPQASQPAHHTAAPPTANPTAPAKYHGTVTRTYRALRFHNGWLKNQNRLCRSQLQTPSNRGFKQRKCGAYRLACPAAQRIIKRIPARTVRFICTRERPLCHVAYFRLLLPPSRLFWH